MSQVANELTVPVTAMSNKKAHFRCSSVSNINNMVLLLMLMIAACAGTFLRSFLPAYPRLLDSFRVYVVALTSE